eukprot:SAG22_NODE_272_length_13192_cov_311.812495_12_plen_201_part_00
MYRQVMLELPDFTAGLRPRDGAVLVGRPAGGVSRLASSGALGWRGAELGQVQLLGAAGGGWRSRRHRRARGRPAAVPEAGAARCLRSGCRRGGAIRLSSSGECSTCNRPSGTGWLVLAWMATEQLPLTASALPLASLASAMEKLELVCFHGEYPHGYDNTCSYHAEIMVVACPGFYLFKLPDVPVCDSSWSWMWAGYCTE